MRLSFLITIFCYLVSLNISAAENDIVLSNYQPIMANAICVDCDNLVPQSQNVSDILYELSKEDQKENKKLFLEMTKLDAAIKLATIANQNSTNNQNKKCNGTCGIPYVYAPQDLIKRQIIFDGKFPTELINMMGFKDGDQQINYIKAKDGNTEILIEISNLKNGEHHVRFYKYPHHLLKNKKADFYKLPYLGSPQLPTINTDVSYDEDDLSTTITAQSGNHSSSINLDLDENIIIQLDTNNDFFQYNFTQTGNLNNDDNNLYRHRISNRDNTFYFEYGFMNQDYQSYKIKKNIPNTDASVILTLTQQQMPDFQYNKATAQLNVKNKKRIKVGIDNLQKHFITIPLKAKFHRIDIDGSSTFSDEYHEHDYTVSKNDKEIATISYSDNDVANKRTIGISKDYKGKDDTYKASTGISYSKAKDPNKTVKGNTGVTFWINFSAKF